MHLIFSNLWTMSHKVSWRHPGTGTCMISRLLGLPERKTTKNFYDTLTASIWLSRWQWRQSITYRYCYEHVIASKRLDGSLGCPTYTKPTHVKSKHCPIQKQVVWTTTVWHTIMIWNTDSPYWNIQHIKAFTQNGYSNHSILDDPVTSAETTPAACADDWSNNAIT
jgi:hypothetical protein